MPVVPVYQCARYIIIDGTTYCDWDYQRAYVLAVAVILAALMIMFKLFAGHYNVAQRINDWRWKRRLRKSKAEYERERNRKGRFDIYGNDIKEDKEQ